MLMSNFLFVSTFRSQYLVCVCMYPVKFLGEKTTNLTDKLMGAEHANLLPVNQKDHHMSQQLYRNFQKIPFIPCFYNHQMLVSE